ncbi:hypothetical protein B0H19DRAFT_1144692 [Mycena capillaripes]|nr:hypothetical protein B0H19DRAFT_1144692 [Mycena capillaripes]
MPNGPSVHKAPTYPVLTLPPEIVAEIFVDFLPNYPELPPISGPLQLCAICQRWRQIALSTPILWRAIRIHTAESEHSEILEKKLELLITWLKRSGNYPLSLKLTCHLARFLEAIILHCQRWEYVDVVAPIEHLRLIQGDMPLLQNATFGPTIFPRGSSELTLFDRAPQLKKVVFTRFSFKPVISVPWTQLTHLDAHCVFENECTAILSDATHLVHCQFSVCGGEEPSTQVAVVHAHLRHLTFVVYDLDAEADLQGLLDNLTLPAIHTLRVYQSEGPLLDSFKAFISRSHCTLKELRVDGSSLSELTYREVLPSIESIIVVETGSE